MGKFLLVWCLVWGMAHPAYALVDQDAPLQEREPAATTVLEQIEAGNAQEALAAAQELVERSPDKATSYIIRARAYAAAGQRDAAINDLSKALQLAPIDVHAASDLARLQARAGDFDKAHQTLDTPTRRRPTSTLLKIAFADVLIAEGKLRDAGMALIQASQNAHKQNHQRALADALAAAYERLSTAQHATGDPGAAISSLTSALAQQPSQPILYAIKLADLYHQTGQLETAHKQLQELATRRAVAQDPALLEQVQQHLRAVEQSQADRAQQQARAEVLAKDFVAIIDAYRRNPADARARQAVIDAIKPYHAALFHTQPNQLLLPISDQQPEGLAVPPDLDRARGRAFELYQRYDVFGLFRSDNLDDYRQASALVIQVYPAAFVLRQYAEQALYERDFAAAYDFAALAEAVLFAEQYYRRQTNADAPYSDHFIVRRLAHLAHLHDQPDQQTPAQADLHRLLTLQSQQHWLQADTLRNELSQTLSGSTKFAYRDLLDRAWLVDRKPLEKAYHDAFQQAVELDHVQEMDRIARYLFTQDVRDQRFAGLLLNHLSMEGEPDAFNRYFNQLMKQDPYHIYALHYAALRARQQNNTTHAMLYANAVVQFIEEAGSPRQLQGILTTTRNTLQAYEATLKPDPANGYWQASIAFEQFAADNKLPPHASQTVIEAAAMRIIELAPNNPAIVGLIAQMRFRSRNYAGCIDAANQALAMTPTAAGRYQLLLGDAYHNLLPASTLDRDALKANYLKAIDYYQQALATGRFGDKATISKLQAQMYQNLDMVDQALAQHRAVTELTTVGQERGYAYYQIAKLTHDHDKAPRQQVLAALEQSIQAYTQSPPESFVDSSAYVSATALLAKLTRPANDGPPPPARPQ